MSDTAPSNTPVPWLQQDGQTATAPEHAWGMPSERYPLIGIRYQPSLRDHWQCLNRVVWVRPGVNLLFFYFFGTGALSQPFIPMLIAMMKSAVSGHWAIPKINGQFLLLKMAVGILSLILVKSIFTCFSVIVELFKRSAEMKQERNLLLTSEGIEEIVGEKTTTIDWEKVVAIIEEGGALYLLGPKIEIGFYIPRSAFTDRNAAKRFHAAASSLWKARGNPVGILPEVRAEFAV